MTRWKDTLPAVDGVPSLTWVAWTLAVALRAQADESRDISAAYAAAHIRAYRKSLGVEGAHRRKACQQVDEGALWSALESVAAAALADDPHTKAVWCRYAEADLREMWKRGQA